MGSVKADAWTVYVSANPHGVRAHHASCWHAISWGFTCCLPNRFRKESLNEETLELLAPYLEMEDFDASFARRTCGNMAGLCTWVQGLATWFIVSKSVKPKQEAVAVAQAAMDAKRKQLQRAEASLVKAEMAIQAVMQEYEECMQSKAELKVELTVIRCAIPVRLHVIARRRVLTVCLCKQSEPNWMQQRSCSATLMGNKTGGKSSTQPSRSNWGTASCVNESACSG